MPQGAWRVYRWGMDEKASLGSALRAARERADLSLREVEARARDRGASISASYLSDLEKGRYEALSVERLVTLACIYGDTPERIMREANMVQGETADFLDLRQFDPQMRAYLSTLAHIASGESMRRLEVVERMTAANRAIITLILEALRKIAADDKRLVHAIDGITRQFEAVNNGDARQ